MSDVGKRLCKAAEWGRIEEVNALLEEGDRETARHCAEQNKFVTAFPLFPLAGALQALT